MNRAEAWSDEQTFTLHQAGKDYYIENRFQAI